MNLIQREKFPAYLIKFQFNFQYVKITEMQLLVRLALAGTIHKAQGQSLGMRLVDFCSKIIFSGSALSCAVALQEELGCFTPVQYL